MNQFAESKKIKTKDFVIVTCSCYVYDWKKIKENDDDSWKFDEIGKGKKCLRKCFLQCKTLFHCCYGCFEKAVMLNPFTLDDEQRGFCIVKRFLNAIANFDEICNACLHYFVKNYSKKSFNSIL